MYKKGFKNTKVIALLSVLLALHVVLTATFVQVTPELRVYFTFFIKALAAIVAGPFVGIGFGMMADLIGVMIFPSGAYFFGYTLTAMVSMFIYGCFFYQKKLTILRIFIAKLSVNVIANIILNSFWSYLLYSKGYVYYLIQSVIKNILLLPIEVILLIIFLKLMLPTLNRLKYTQQDHIPWI